MIRLSFKRSTLKTKDWKFFMEEVLKVLSKNISNKLRQATGVNGLLSLILGLLILFLPGQSAMGVTVMVGVVFIIIGLFDILSIFKEVDENTWVRLGHLLLGLLYLIVGIFVCVNLAASATYLFLLVGIFVGITWLVEGFVELGTVQLAVSKGWTIFSAVLSIIAGIILLMTPLYGAVMLWTLLGAILVVLGIFKVAHYLAWQK